MTGAAPLCLPPRPVGNGTGLRVFPPGTCDTHMHVFGPAERYPLVPARTYTPYPVTFSDYRPVMAALGIDRAVLVQPSVYGTDNSALLDTLRSAPDALRGVVVVPPDLPDADLHDLHRAGVRGIRVNRRNPGGLSLEHVARLGSRIAPLGWHIQLQIEIAKAPDLTGMVERCPVPMVIDHFGFLDPRQSMRGGPFAQMLRLLEGGNLWVKLSAPYRVSLSGRPYADLSPFVEAVVGCRPDRLLWATDWPHTELWADMPDDMDPSDRMIPDALPPQVRALILVENPARLYGFALPAR